MPSKLALVKKRGVRIQDLLPPHSSSAQEVTELVSQHEEINLEEPRITASAKIGIKFMRRINPQSSPYVRRARPPWEDSERGGVFQDSVQCVEGGGPVVASPSMVVCRTIKNIRCGAHLGLPVYDRPPEPTDRPQSSWQATQAPFADSKGVID